MEKYKGLVSIVMPVYNSSDTIIRAVDSVLRQTYVKLELWIVDNGSTDDTLQKINSYIHDSRVNVINSAKGRSQARNEGIRHANGEYLAFLDSDDAFAIDHIARGVRFLEKNMGYFAYIDQSVLMQDDEKIGEVTSFRNTSYSDLVRQNFIPISAPVIRNEKVTLFDEELDYNEDWLFWLRTLENRSFFTDDENVGSYIYVTGRNTMANPIMRSTRLYVFSNIEKRVRNKNVGLLRLVVEAAWYVKFRNQLPLTINNQVNVEFRSLIIFARLVQLLPGVDFLMQRRLLNNRY